MNQKNNFKNNLSNSNFIRLLQNFTKKEIAEFMNFISSPFFNNQKTLIRLFSEIKKYYPNFTDKKFTKELLFDSVNPGKIYNDTVFRKYISNLMKLTEDYLIVKENLNNEERKNLSLLNQLERKNLFPFFNKIINRNNGESSNAVKHRISSETFYYCHFKEELKSNLAIRSNNLHLLKPSLVSSQKYLLLYLLLTSVVNGNMLMVNRNSFKEQKNNKMVEDFFDYFDMINYLEMSGQLNEHEKLFIELCRNDIVLLKNPYNINVIKMMKNNILGLTEYLDKNLLYVFFSHLNIYYLINISGGKPELNIDLLDNYKLMLKMELYFYEGVRYINFSEYKTILLLALRLKEYKWSLEFIDRFKNHHAAEMKQDIYNFSLAFLNFEEGKFDESLKHLSEIKINDLIFKLDCDVLKLLVYYELNYFDSANSLLDSFKYFVKKNTILSDNAKKIQFDFIKYFKEALKYKISGSISDYDYDRLKKELSEKTTLKRKSWFLEKLNSLYDSQK